ncbi:RagB/SusD family nutrient uptake outer membrane protein [Marivirga sp. S37H4]|uniref:RagB/SusD family nutrient uptake outer membrane protein n=1 Tax=Marivirga aurantiaca TaxID=2802615 RepID=A0A934WWD5_9BACT|nr:RagB/SusD family nutrient uptake outer membrane protein [Marivirga aurantiaca]MBK6264299.1 RagB/SusD family nutrient uptake outer membrane protein [Marivirga aurantiaca]
MKSMKFIYIAILVVFISSCQDEFIETEPQATILEDNYYQSEEQMFRGLIAAYDPLQWTFADGAWSSSVMLGEIRSDNANAGGDPSDGDQPGWQAIDDFLNTSLTLESQAFWKKGWWGVYRANLIINNDKLSSEVIDEYKAEAKFLRAFYHFDMFRTFGPVPIIDHVILENEYSEIERANLTELFEFISNDLEEAIPLLQEAKYTGSLAGRVSRTTAQALLGKVYLYWADLANDDPNLFDQAATHLNNVITSGQYQLVDDYHQLFAFGVKNSEESVFEIQHTNAVPSDWGGAEFIDGNMMTQLCGIRGLCSDHPEYEAGWGFLLPTESLNSHFLDDDAYRRTASIISATELSTDGCNVDLAEQNSADFDGYFQIKYANYKDYTAPNGGDPVLQKDPNQPVIRYADVLLMYAEALERGSGSSGEAMEHIDMVRERAAGPGDNSGNFRDTQQLMAEEGLTLLEAIWYERRAEFAIEGDRWFDLVRSGRVDNNLFSAQKASNLDQSRIYLPIPQRDIDNTGGSLTEYPSAELFN